MESNNHVIVTELVNAYSDDLFRFALSKTNDAEVAQDLVQDTFIVAFQKWDNFRGDSAPKTWLISILKFKIADHFRKKVKAKVSSLDTKDISDSFQGNGHWIADKSPILLEDAEHLLDNPEFNVIFKNCIEALPETWNTVIKYKYIEPKESKEICKELGITDTNLWQIVHRAKLKLKECLKSNWINQ
jgi:RNA polymerase sigma-70 factor (ECF subfamily)